jgi:hypothetical protein
MPAINPPQAAFFLLPPGVTLPEQTAEAYMLAYADGYTLNFLFAAAFPLGQSFAIISTCVLFVDLIKSVTTSLHIPLLLVEFFHHLHPFSCIFESSEFTFVFS